MTATDATWIDVTVPIEASMTTWPGQPATRLERLSEITPNGDSPNVSALYMSLHTGTHLDAPVHFIKDGPDITTAPPEVTIGPVQVVCTDAAQVTAGVLDEYESRRRGLIPEGGRVFFRTRNSDQDWWTQPFKEDYVAVSPDAADWLVHRGVALVGVDYLSVAPFTDPQTTHKKLLSAGVWVVEGLRLGEISEGQYDMVALPLKIKGGDASPVRVLLRRG